MRCPACGSENVADASFCGECAAALTGLVNCPSCGRANPPKQKFCNGCGQSVASSADRATSTERGYTPKHLAEKILSSRSCPRGRAQAGHSALRRREGVDGARRKGRSGGVVSDHGPILPDPLRRGAPFRGDCRSGSRAMESWRIFGAPIAHEDHARRACHAALHLRDELRRYAEELKRTRGLSFSVRMGLNSGEVVVGTIGDDLKMVYTAHGNAVGLGQRMEQLATPEQVYLTEHSAKLVSGFFRLRDLGPFELKGVSAPLRVYELEGVGALHTPTRSLTLTRILALRRPSGRNGGSRSRARPGDRRERAGRRHRRRAGGRQEPALLRVPRALPGTGPCDLPSARRSAREGDPPATDPRALPELLRHHGRGLRSGRA